MTVRFVYLGDDTWVAPAHVTSVTLHDKIDGVIVVASAGGSAVTTRTPMDVVLAQLAGEEV